MIDLHSHSKSQQFALTTLACHLHVFRFIRKVTGLADEGELGFMKSVKAQFEKIVVAKAKGADEQTANLAFS